MKEKTKELEKKRKHIEECPDDVVDQNLLRTYLFEGIAANSNSQFDNKPGDVSYYKLDRRDILQMEKDKTYKKDKEENEDKNEESSFSIVRADAMVDGGSVADIYDKTISGVAEQARKSY